MAGPVVRFIDNLRQQHDQQIIVLIPVVRPDHLRDRLLHNQIDLVLTRALQTRTDIILTRVTYRRSSGTTPPARDEGHAAPSRTRRPDQGGPGRDGRRGTSPYDAPETSGPRVSEVVSASPWLAGPRGWHGNTDSESMTSMVRRLKRAQG